MVVIQITIRDMESKSPITKIVNPSDRAGFVELTDIPMLMDKDTFRRLKHSQLRSFFGKVLEFIHEQKYKIERGDVIFFKDFSGESLPISLHFYNLDENIPIAFYDGKKLIPPEKWNYNKGKIPSEFKFIYEFPIRYWDEIIINYPIPFDTTPFLDQIKQNITVKHLSGFDVDFDSTGDYVWYSYFTLPQKSRQKSKIHSVDPLADYLIDPLADIVSEYTKEIYYVVSTASEKQINKYRLFDEGRYDKLFIDSLPRPENENFPFRYKSRNLYSEDDISWYLGTFWKIPESFRDNTLVFRVKFE